MSIIKVTTNVLEDYQVTTTVKTPFNPFIVARFPSGPVGEWVKLSNVRELQTKFGNITASLPVAYGIKQYLSEYRDIYVYRVASSKAKQGTAEISFQGLSKPIKLLSLKTKYSTEQLNGSLLKINKEDELNAIYLTLTTPNRTYRTSNYVFEAPAPTPSQGNTTSGDNTSAQSGETSTQGTSTQGTSTQVTAVEITAPDLAKALEQLVNSLNAVQDLCVITNEFSPSKKTESDEVPSDYENLEAQIELGDSGNTLTEIKHPDVINSLQYLQDYDIIIDAILAPEFDDKIDIVQALSVKADQGDYVHLVAPTHDIKPENSTPVEVATQFIAYTNQLPACKSRIILYPSVYVNNIDDNGVIQGQVEMPLSVVALRTYAITDDIGKWYAPEGISDINKRGLLTNVVSMKVAVPTDAAEILYNAKNPVNYLQYISGIGVILFGDKTNLASSKVFSKIHVVRLSKYLHRVYQNIGLSHIGEPIDDFTYEDISAKFRRELDSIVAARGIEAYTVKCDTENNTEEMRQDGIIYTLSRIKFFNIAEIIENDLVFTNYIAETDTTSGEEDRLV